MTKIIIKSIIVLILFMHPVYGQKFGKISDTEWSQGAPEDYPEANAIILFDKAKMQITLNDISTERHIRIKVLTKAGADEVGDRVISYYKKDKIKHFKAQTITPDGKKHKIEKNTIFEKEVNNWKEKAFSFPNVSEGCIVEYRYVVLSDRYWNLPTWYFQQEIYSMKSIFTVSLGAGFAFDMSYRNVPARYKKPKVENKPDPTSSLNRKLKFYTWEAVNLPPIKDEPYMSSVNDYRSSLRFLLISYTNPNGSKQVLVKNWLDQAKDLQVWFDDYCNKDKDIKKLTEEITSDLTTQQEKSKAIFDYIKAEYISLDNYNTRYFNHKKIEKLLEEKTGTPEGKNMLLCEMHKAAGIDSWPVLISTRRNSKVDPTYPDDRQFNYVITFVQIGDAWEFLDAADRNSLYGILQPQCLTDIGFLIDGNNSELVRMTIKPIPSVREDITHMRIASDGNVVCSTKCNFSGYYAANYIDKYDNNTPEEFIDKYIKDRLDVSCEIDHYDCETDSLSNFKISTSYTSDEFVRILDNNLIIKPISLAYKENPFKSENRFFPIDFTYPFTYQNIVKIKIDNKPTEIHLPDDVSVDIGGVNFLRQTRMENEEIVVTQILNVLQPEFKQRKYHKIKELFGKIALANEDEITVILSN